MGADRCNCVCQSSRRRMKGVTCHDSEGCMRNGGVVPSTNILDVCVLDWTALRKLLETSERHCGDKKLSSCRCTNMWNAMDPGIGKRRGASSQGSGTMVRHETDRTAINTKQRTPPNINANHYRNLCIHRRQVHPTHSHPHACTLATRNRNAIITIGIKS